MIEDMIELVELHRDQIRPEIRPRVDWRYGGDKSPPSLNTDRASSNP